VVSRAADIFERSKIEQKRQLIAFVFSNLKLKGKKLEFSLRSPFDLMVNRRSYASWLVGYAITVTLITAALGAATGALSDGRSFISGPDSNTFTVLASISAALGTMEVAGDGRGQIPLQLALATTILTCVFCGLTFFFVARANLSQLVRYIPFSVMAGFLAATGWLIASGALNIIAALFDHMVIRKVSHALTRANKLLALYR
jgi:MFS superfamily sulfate permease-like transporter